MTDVGACTNDGGLRCLCPGATCIPPFALTSGVLTPEEDVRVKVQVLGAAITYGARGPEVDVRVSANGEPLFGNQDIDGGEETSLVLNNGGPLNFTLSARYLWFFRKTYTTNSDIQQFLYLRNGDSLPDIPGFANQLALRSLLAAFLTTDGRMALQDNQIIYAAELGVRMSPGQPLPAAADFNDAVFLVTVEKPSPAPWCGPGGPVSTPSPTAPPSPLVTSPDDSCNVSLVVRFQTTRNSGGGNRGDKGNLAPRVDIKYRNGSMETFADGAIIPLIAGGRRLHDPQVERNVPGLSLRRRERRIDLSLYGGHGSRRPGMEELEATLELQGGVFTSFRNAPKSHGAHSGPLEQQGDGVYELGNPGQDELVFTPGTSQARWYSTVTTDSDSFTLFYEPTVGADGCRGKCLPPQLFTIGADGRIHFPAPVHVHVQFLGGAGVYLPLDPETVVEPSVDVEDDSGWTTVFETVPDRGTEFLLSSRRSLALRFRGKLRWFPLPILAPGQWGRLVQILTRESPLPPALTIDRAALPDFLQAVITPDGSLNIGPDEALVLVDFNADNPTYRALALLLSFEPVEKPTCTVSAPPPSPAPTSTASPSPTTTPPPESSPSPSPTPTIPATPPTSCTSAAECNDGQFCTVDTCESGVCSHTSKDCSDGNLCTRDFCREDLDLCDHSFGNCLEPLCSITCSEGTTCHPTCGTCSTTCPPTFP